MLQLDGNPNIFQNLIESIDSALEDNAPTESLRKESLKKLVVDGYSDILEQIDNAKDIEEAKNIVKNYIKNEICKVYADITDIIDEDI